jgi:hypothetical protein
VVLSIALVINGTLSINLLDRSVSVGIPGVRAVVFDHLGLGLASVVLIYAVPESEFLGIRKVVDYRIFDRSGSIGCMANTEF